MYITALINRQKYTISGRVNKALLRKEGKEMRKFIGVFALLITAVLYIGGYKEASAVGNTSIAITKENFPNKRLRKIIVEDCDRNKDYVLSREEIQKAEKISIGLDEEMEDYDLKGLSILSELKKVEIEAFEVENVRELEKLPHLQYLRIMTLDSCPVTTDKNPELEKLDLNVSIKRLDLSKNKKLKSLKLENSEVKKLSICNLPKLKYVRLANNMTKSVVIKNCPKLRTLRGNGNKKITKLDLRPLKKLCNFEWKYGILRRIQFGKKKYLRLVNVKHNKLKKLDIRKMRRLSRKHVYVNGNPNIKILK